MNINDFRKKFFLNSQYCTYYTDKGCTVIAGIMRNIGYKYAVKLPDEKITLTNKIYRKLTTLINCFIGAEILIYVYFFIFPNFLKLMQMNYFVMLLILSFIPLIMLYLTYIAVNYLYEIFLAKYIGTFKKVKFEPTIYNIDFKAYEQYKNTPRKSSFVLILILGIFLYYIFTPIVIDKLVYAQKYSLAIKSANVYSKIIPILPDVYAQRAYAKFKLNKYQDAVIDYKLANKYSLSNAFDKDILGVKTYYLPFIEMINEFDKAIKNEVNNSGKQFLLSEKAAYLMKNQRYNEVVNIYDELMAIYKKQKNINFDIVEVYYNRGLVKLKLGDITGSKLDIAVAKKMQPEYKFNPETKLVVMP